MEGIIIHALCKCNVWPLKMPNPVGHCGRCGEQPVALSIVIDKEEALEIFKERNGHYPLPVRSRNEVP